MMATGLFVDAASDTTTERALTADEIAANSETPQQQLARLQVDCTTNRRGAYAAESDPLFFLWQRGESTQADWLTAVADIRTRYPMPDA